MTSAGFLAFSISAGLIAMSAAFVLTAVRIIRGPTLSDRILALDMLVSVGIGFIVVIGIKTGFYLYVDIAIALGLVGFLATIAFARFVLHRGEEDGPKSEVDNA